MSKTSVNWAELASDLGAAPSPAAAGPDGLLLGDQVPPTTSLTVTSMSSDVARGAVCRIVGDQAWRDAVLEYLAWKSHRELILGVLRLLKPRAAVAECLRIWREGTGEERVTASELLRHVASRSELAILPELLTDPDARVRVWAIPLVRELWWDAQIESDDVEPLLSHLSEYPQDAVRALIRELQGLLNDWRGDPDPGDTALERSSPDLGR